MNYFEARKISQDYYQTYQLPAYLKNIIQNLPKNARILDFGCGFGQILFAIKELENNDKKKRGGGYQLTGIDIDAKAIDFCQKCGLNAQKIEDIFYYEPLEKFDLIIMTHVLEHFPKDKIISLLEHFKRTFLKPNAKIFIAVPNAQSHTGCYWAYEDFTHQTLFTAGSLHYVLKMSGFNQIDFIDIDCTYGTKWPTKIIRKIFLNLYRIKMKFWNLITASSFHQPSPEIYSYEIKVIAS